VRLPREVRSPIGMRLPLRPNLRHRLHLRQRLNLPLGAFAIVWLFFAQGAMGQVTGTPPEQGDPARAALKPAAVEAAVDQLRRDPNLGRDKTERSLRWVDRKSKDPVPANVPKWIVGLFEFINQAAGLLLWVAGGVAFAFAAVWVHRVLKARRPAPAPADATSVSQVSDLDIRPASLPADVGGAALGMLRVGRVRDALSLLYRGALSRAVHNFSASIAESCTEGEALRAATLRLDPARAQYFSTLVGLWQRAVYAHELPPDERVAALCADFSPMLDQTRI